MKRVLFCLLLLVALSGCGRRETHRRVSLATLPTGGAMATRAPEKVALRVAVAPVLSPRETLKSYSDLVEYLGKRLGRPPELIQGSSYAEINELVRYGNCDVAFV